MATVDPIALDLVDFLNASPTNFHAVDEAKKRLKQAGFVHLSEREDWVLEPGGKYFFTRNHSTIVTFAIGKKSVTEAFKFNTHSHLIPVLATSVKGEIQKLVDQNGPCKSNAKANVDNKKHHPVLLQLIADQAHCHPDEICDFELQVCDTQPSVIGGAMKEFIFSGRVDNLCMSFCALKALIDSISVGSLLDEESGVRMVALFDHEEFLEKAIQRSFLVSADMAHALHPNFMDKHEENHQPKLHDGLVIKHNANQRYATNAVTAFIFREIAEMHNLPIQDFVVRNDMPCGSTIGPILASGVGIRTVDVGAPQLSMHSIREMCAVDDAKHSYEHFKAYFNEFTKLEKKLVIDL
ncbi:hypothetical protein C4D60_Mb10t13610 [Musa balbisiana]|uniref:Aspartyl aminopeptidase n=1 Tax=Musa balbisiana TaxID=52838 RepID=A0A4S8IWZ2_MUSBA|nr:hypothetical protein C4D60_Mb10t13610 [Musa balbisiana]